jgi:hypothetical protein
LSNENHNHTEATSAGNVTKSKSRGVMSSRKSAYVWGAASGVAFALFAPIFRPAARNAVKGGIRVGRYAKKVGSKVKEEFQDIAAEAQADLDREQNSDNK